jgi:pimeloyl-ACP methyl ester carboxylesterase
VAELADVSYRVIAPDNPGHGWSVRQARLAAECRARHADWKALAPRVWELWMRPLELAPERLARVTAPTCC